MSSKNRVTIIAVMSTTIVLLITAIMLVLYYSYRNNSGSVSTASVKSEKEIGRVFKQQEIEELNNTLQNSGTKEALIQVTARPSFIIDDSGKHVDMTIHDVNNGQKQDGLYQLQVFCLGEGNLHILFKIGEVSKTGSLQCADSITQTSITLQTAASESSEVTVEPSKNSQAQIAYRIDYSS